LSLLVSLLGLTGSLAYAQNEAPKKPQATPTQSAMAADFTVVYHLLSFERNEDINEGFATISITPMRTAVHTWEVMEF